MKTFTTISIFALLLFFIGSFTTDAQVVKTRDRAYKRAVKQRTKEFSKKGFSPKGAGTIELYIQKALNKEFDTDENGENKNFWAPAQAVDPTYEGAVAACRASARAALAGNIETRVAELIKRSLDNDQISARSANGINQTIIAGKQLIAQKISMEDLYIFYREVKDERDGKTLIEVEYEGAYSRKFAMQKAQEYIREQMKNETEELHKDLDKIFKFE